MRRKEYTKVHFVGAGPGAVDLITIRGKELLEDADVIIYAGSLVNPKLLDYAKEDCEIHNSATMTLDEVVEVMKTSVLLNKKVVRLHTGDPSLYGAIKEQMDALKRLNISYEICPGVSSFNAAAAALNVEYTLPGVSQSVIITRAEGRTKVPPLESIQSFAAHGTSMVLFLSTGLLNKVSKDLIAGGYSKDTPAAIVYKASWPEQQIVRCTIESLDESAKQHNITKTALICVGSFLDSDYELSRLYAPDFETEFRKASE